jgi:hypothetical protein
MPEWRPGEIAMRLKEIEAKGKLNQRKGLLLIAAAIEAEAKAALSKTSHPYGTPSPAPQGGPPALVTGTGRRSIGHESVPGGIIKVGTAVNVFPPSRPSKRGSGGNRTPSSKYLLYQETLSKFGHPFLKPAFLKVIREKSVEIWLKSFRGGF